LQKLKVGLALGSGGARGLAHIGVLAVLEKEGIPIDMIAGSSAGALIGALYAQGRSIAQMKNWATESGTKRLSFLANPGLPRTGLFQIRKIVNVLKSTIGDTEFGDLRIPFACVAADIITGEEVVIKQGLVWKGVRASVSIPVLITLAKWEDRYLADGSLVNPVPVSVLREMGANFIIAVSTTPDLSMEKEKEPNIFNITMQTIYIVTHRLLKSSLTGANVVIKPQTASIGYFDFRRAEECISQGEVAARKLIPEIKEKLKRASS